MRQHRLILSFVVSIAILTASGTSVLPQEYRGTMEQQMACTPDVFRLCGAQIPDVNSIVACLRQNTPVLSAPCRAVFESSNRAVNPPPTNPPAPVTPPVRRNYQY